MIGHCCDCLVGELNCLASTHWLIMQPTLCSSTLLELISSHSFNLYYMKGKDMILSDFLSRQMNQVRSSGVKLPEVHGMGKNLDPNLKPEKQHAISKQGSMERPHMGQGRTGIRRKRPDTINQSIN